MTTMQPGQDGRVWRWLMYCLVAVVIGNHLVRLTTGGGEIAHLKNMTHWSGDVPQQALYRVDQGRRRVGAAVDSLTTHCPDSIVEMCSSMTHAINVVAGLH